MQHGTAPQSIGYFSFTRKASEEAKERAVKRFPDLNERTDFPFFRTLHSLAFSCVGARKDDIMSDQHYYEFARLVGLDMNVSHNETGVAKGSNNILDEIDLARIRGTDLRTHYNQSGLSIEWFHLEYVERSYRKYKEDHELMDFTDLLAKVAVNPSLLPALDVVIIDEAQDLSALQWDIVSELVKKSKRAYLAGDDDQAIFNWAGSDVKRFLRFAGEVHVLEQSYRVPKRVHRLANDIITKLPDRQQKNWKARDFDGDIYQHPDYQYVPVQQGNWLILASTKYHLKPVMEWLADQGLLYEFENKRSIPDVMLQAVYGWERLRTGKSIPGTQVEIVYRYMGTEFVAKGFKKFRQGDPEGMYDMDTLKAEYGLLTDEPWTTALSRISMASQVYISAVLRRGTKFSENARIQVSTIHGAKGGEADNVMLLLDLSPKFVEEHARDDSDLRRLLYVALTRTKQTLHLVLAKNSERSFQI